jgi:AraC-like DNA-binding protein
MPKVSIAFVLCAVLAFIAVRLAISSSGNRRTWPLLVLLSAAALQALLVGLRWDVGIQFVRPLQIFLAAMLPALTWISFRPFVTSSRIRASDWLLFVPAILAGFAIAVFPDAVDIIIMATFVGFGVACLRLATRGEAALVNTALSGVIDVQRALWLATFSLFASPIIDLFVVLDFLQNKGARVASYIGFGNLLWLVAIGAFALWAGKSVPEEDEPQTDDKPAVVPEVEDQRIAALVETKLVDGLAKDANLSLTRLARRCGVSARQVSHAINRVHKKSVSQFVNDIRIREACRLLETSDISVTQAIYDSGFQTKSNFNREFLRVTGKTPRDWRKAQS